MPALNVTNAPVCSPSLGVIGWVTSPIKKRGMKP